MDLEAITGDHELRFLGAGIAELGYERRLGPNVAHGRAARDVNVPLPFRVDHVDEELELVRGQRRIVQAVGRRHEGSEIGDHRERRWPVDAAQLGAADLVPATRRGVRDLEAGARLALRRRACGRRDAVGVGRAFGVAGTSAGIFRRAFRRDAASVEARFGHAIFTAHATAVPGGHHGDARHTVHVHADRPRHYGVVPKKKPHHDGGRPSRQVADLRDPYARRVVRTRDDPVGDPALGSQNRRLDEVELDTRSDVGTQIDDELVGRALAARSGSEEPRHEHIGQPRTHGPEDN